MMTYKQLDDAIALVSQRKRVMQTIEQLGRLGVCIDVVTQTGRNTIVLTDDVEAREAVSATLTQHYLSRARDLGRALEDLGVTAEG